jgi:hypothetical protein
VAVVEQVAQGLLSQVCGHVTVDVIDQHFGEGVQLRVPVVLRASWLELQALLHTQQYKDNVVDEQPTRHSVTTQPQPPLPPAPPAQHQPHYHPTKPNEHQITALTNHQ